MCKIDHRLHFCSCKGDEAIEVFGEGPYGKTILLWTLHKYLGTYDSGLDGLVMPSQHVLSVGLKSDDVLYELNQANAFDFDYFPKEGDNLLIMEFSVKGKVNYAKLKKRSKRNDYIRQMSYVFRAGLWFQDDYDPFSIKKEEFKQGVVARKKTSGQIH